MMMSIKVIMLQLGLTAFYFLRLLIQFIIRGNNTFDMGVWYGTMVWYGIFVPYRIPNRRTIPGFTVCPVPWLIFKRVLQMNSVSVSLIKLMIIQQHVQLIRIYFINTIENNDLCGKYLLSLARTIHWHWEYLRK